MSNSLHKKSGSWLFSKLIGLISYFQCFCPHEWGRPRDPSVIAPTVFHQLVTLYVVSLYIVILSAHRRFMAEMLPILYPINQSFCTSLGFFFTPVEQINKPIQLVFLSSIVSLMNWLHIVNVNLDNFSVMLNGHHYRRRLPACFGLCSWTFAPTPLPPISGCDAMITVYPPPLRSLTMWISHIIIQNFTLWLSHAYSMSSCG